MLFRSIKVNGKKLYEYAREGKEVEIEPRKVNIYKLDLLNFDKEANTVELVIECSKGTYIRSIANDLGEKIGTFGHLIKLERIKAGKFLKNDAIKLEDLKTIQDVKENLIYPLEKLEFPIYELNDVEQEKISHGMPLVLNKEFNQEQLLILVYNNKISAIAKYCNGIIRCEKVFL